MTRMRFRNRFDGLLACTWIGARRSREIDSASRTVQYIIMHDCSLNIHGAECYRTTSTIQMCNLRSRVRKQSSSLGTRGESRSNTGVSIARRVTSYAGSTTIFERERHTRGGWTAGGEHKFAVDTLSKSPLNTSIFTIYASKSSQWG
jgi:hypothetical protein